MFESIATAPPDIDEDEPKSPLRKILLTLLLLFAGAALLAAFLFLPYVRARSLLADATSLQVGKSTFDDARQIAEKWGKLPDGCTATECLWIHRVDNFALPVEYRGEGEIFTASFHVSHGIVDGRNFGYWIGTGPSVSAASVDEQLHWKPETLASFQGKSYEVLPHTAATNPHYRVVVRLQTDAPPDIRSKYFAFNLNCLWQYKGCQDAQQLLPAAEWQ